MNRRKTQVFESASEMSMQQSLGTRKSRSKSMNRRNTQSFENAGEMSMQQSLGITKQRSKNFVEAECKILVEVCDKYFDVINKNSNREVDKTAKSQAWVKIKHA